MNYILYSVIIIWHHTIVNCNTPVLFILSLLGETLRNLKNAILRVFFSILNVSLGSICVFPTWSYSFVQAFEKTCIYKSHLNSSGKQLGNFLKRASGYEIKLTCPLGLVWDIICTFSSCLNSECNVEGKECATELDSIDEDCLTSINLKLYCKVGILDYTVSNI